MIKVAERDIKYSNYKILIYESPKKTDMILLNLDTGVELEASILDKFIQLNKAEGNSRSKVLGNMVTHLITKDKT